jgi:glycosyltransferase involved in cell wall biosynthesis
LFKTRRVQRILSAKRFDVIHFHNISLVGGPGILRYSDAIKLYTLHEYWLICPTHVLFKFQRAACTEKECFRCQLSYHRPPQLWRCGGLMKESLRHVDAFIAPSEWVRQRHLAEYPDLPIVHLPHFLSATTERAEAPALPTRPFFLLASRLEKWKGLQTIIPAIRKSSEFELVIAGDGDYADELKRLAGDCGRIHFLGRLTQAQLRTAYEHAIALLVPTVGFEVFPMVLLESFAARTPVIVRDLGPLPGIVAESGGGLVFRDDASLLAAMERLRSNPTLRDNLGAAGHEAWRTRWSEDAHLEHYFRLIGEIHARKQESAAASAGSAVR